MAVLKGSIFAHSTPLGAQLRTLGGGMGYALGVQVGDEEPVTIFADGATQFVELAYNILDAVANCRAVEVSARSGVK